MCISMLFDIANVSVVMLIYSALTVQRANTTRYAIKSTFTLILILETDDGCDKDGDEDGGDRGQQNNVSKVLSDVALNVVCY